MATSWWAHRARIQTRACITLAIAAALGACDSSNSSSGSSCAGKERCACYGNATCDNGLECRSGLCVAAAAAAGAPGNNASNAATAGVASPPASGGAAASGTVAGPSGGSGGWGNTIAEAGVSFLSSGGATIGTGPSTAGAANGIGGVGGSGIGGTVVSAGGTNSVANGGGVIAQGGSAIAGGAAPISGGTSAGGAHAGGAAPAGGGAPKLCGNGAINDGETCDNGAANGLIFGADTDCSPTCLAQPACRSGGTTGACTSACGDGNRDAGEGCDDGNRVAGDGCSPACEVENGFSCVEQSQPVATPCPSNSSLSCLVLGATYRDFDSNAVSSGHPDFFFMGQPGPSGTKLTCIPNASGSTSTSSSTTCASGDSVPLCSGLVQSNLGADGKPQLNTARADGLTCACRYTDWDDTGVLTGSAGVDSCFDGSSSYHERIGYSSTLMVQVIKDATSFAQWFNASDKSTSVTTSLELASSGTNQYTFSSSVPGAAAGAALHTIADDIHEIFMGTGAKKLESGFFPLEEQPRQKVCDIWPYWATGLSSDCAAGTGHPVASQWDTRGSYTAKKEGTGGPVSPVTGTLRNYYFTTEIRYLYRYDGSAASLTVKSGDDLWVFVNGRLVIDFGATHPMLSSTVKLNDSTLGLVSGNLYEIAIFRANRSPRESDFVVTLPGSVDKRSVCSPG